MVCLEEHEVIIESPNGSAPVKLTLLCVKESGHDDLHGVAVYDENYSYFPVLKFEWER